MALTWGCRKSRSHFLAADVRSPETLPIAPWRASAFRCDAQLWWDRERTLRQVWSRLASGITWSGMGMLPSMRSPQSGTWEDRLIQDASQCISKWPGLVVHPLEPVLLAYKEPLRSARHHEKWVLTDEEIGSPRTGTAARPHGPPQKNTNLLLAATGLSAHDPGRW